MPPSLVLPLRARPLGLALVSWRRVVGTCGRRGVLLVALGGTALALLSLGACSTAKTAPKTQAQLQQDAARAYAEAELEFEQHNWEYARQLMDDVRRNYSYTPYARKAQLRLADIAYEQDRLPEAVTEYQAYVHDHPNDAEVPYARLRVIRAHFEETKGTLLQPPVEERDLAPAREAYSEVRAFLADYPNYQPRAELNYMRQAVSGLLARHELYVARFYLKQDQLNAALRRVQHCLRTYDDSGLEPEAEVLLGETYLRMKEPRRSRALFEHVRDHYPTSPFRTVAENFLAFLGPPEAPLDANVGARGALDVN